MSQFPTFNIPDANNDIYEDMTTYERVVVARMLKIGYDYMLNNQGQELIPPVELLLRYDVSEE